MQKELIRRHFEGSEIHYSIILRTYEYLFLSICIHPLPLSSPPHLIREDAAAAAAGKPRLRARFVWTAKAENPDQMYLFKFLSYPVCENINNTRYLFYSSGKLII